MNLAWMWCAAAHAHPFGARFAAHLTDLVVAPDRVEVRYLADVPNPIVAAGARPGRDPLAEMADELRSGLVLQVNGSSTSLTPLGPYDHVATDDTQQFAWTLEARLTDPPRQVTLSNGNLPDVVAVFRGRVEVAGPLAATDCSLWRVRDGSIALDESDRWRTDDRHRTLSVTVRPMAGALTPVWAALTRVGVEPDLAARRHQPPLRVAAARGVITPALAGVVAGAVAAFASLALGLRKRRTITS